MRGLAFKFRILCRQNILNRALIGACFISIMLLITIWSKLSDISAAKNCFKYTPGMLQHFEIHFLEDIVLSTKQPKNGKNIFFHETSCSTNGLVKLNAR